MMPACPKPYRPIRSKAHIAFLRQLPCCVTGHPSGPPHHLLRGSDKCGGRTAGDNFALPMCPEMHDALHHDGDETKFLGSHGIDGPALANALYAATGDHEQGLRVLRELERSG